MLLLVCVWSIKPQLGTLHLGILYYIWNCYIQFMCDEIIEHWMVVVCCHKIVSYQPGTSLAANGRRSIGFSSNEQNILHSSDHQQWTVIINIRLLNYLRKVWTRLPAGLHRCVRANVVPRCPAMLHSYIRAWNTTMSPTSGSLSNGACIGIREELCFY